MKNKKIRYQFIPLPTHLDDWGLLNEDEKSILRRLVRLGTFGWFYGDKKFASILNIGPYHFKRAKYRLHLLGLIRVKKSSPQVSTLYFENQIENWRLTHDLASKFQVDHNNLGHGPLHFHREPFKSRQHFEATFATAFPRFANGRKGRAKHRENIEAADFDFSIEQIEASEPNIKPSPFEKRLQRHDESNTLKILADYYSYRTRIEECKENPPADEFEGRFYHALDQAAQRLVENPTDEIKEILSEVSRLFSEGRGDLAAAQFIDTVRMNKKKQAEQSGSHL